MAQQAPTQKIKRDVRFTDGQEPEPLSSFVSPSDAAAAVSVEYLVSQAAQSKRPEGDILMIPRPTSATGVMFPTRRRDRHGWYLRYPPMFILAYTYDAVRLFRYLRARAQDNDGRARTVQRLCPTLTRVLGGL